MNEITINLDRLSETERKQALELMDKANKPKAWKPKEGEKYFFINFIGDIEAVNWCTCSFDEKLYTLGNCFKTQKEAEWKLEHLKVKVELQRFADEHNEPIDWDNTQQDKYAIRYFPNSLLNIDICCCVGKEADIVYFTNGEIAKQAIRAIGEERFIKYYFGIEE